MKNIVLIISIILLLKLQVLYAEEQQQIEFIVETKKINANIQFYDSNELGWDIFDYVEQNGEESEGYCSKTNPSFPVTNKNLCEGPNENIGWDFSFRWVENQVSEWQFQIAIIVSSGVSVFLDHQFYYANNSPTQWEGNWNSSDIIQVYSILSEGEHFLNITGLSCCGAYLDIRFTRNGSEWIQFNKKNLEKAIFYNETNFEKYIGSTIYISARKYGGNKPEGQGEEFGNKMVEIFEKAEQPSGYCDITYPVWPITLHKSCGYNINNSIAWLMSFNFYLTEACTLAFQFGVDFGKGGVLFVDGKYVWGESKDIWWGGSDFNNKNVIKYSQDFTVGYHNFQLFGLEQCCDGNNIIRFKKNKSQWKELTQQNWEQMNPSPRTELIIETRKKIQEIKVKEEQEFYWELRTNFDKAPRPAGYCYQSDPALPIDIHTLCESSPKFDILFETKFYFYEHEENSVYSFQIGIGGNQGYVVLLDGDILQSSQKKKIWKGNWDSNDLINIENIEVKQGQHDLMVLGMEGSQKVNSRINIKIKRNDSEWKLIRDAQQVIPKEHPNSDQYKIEVQKFVPNGFQ